MYGYFWWAKKYGLKVFCKNISPLVTWESVEKDGLHYRIYHMDTVHKRVLTWGTISSRPINTQTSAGSIVSSVVLGICKDTLCHSPIGTSEPTALFPAGPATQSQPCPQFPSQRGLFFIILFCLSEMSFMDRLFVPVKRTHSHSYPCEPLMKGPECWYLLFLGSRSN